MTLAGLEGWKAEQAREQSNWWQTLASQVPPGILLLFLLATLAADSVEFGRTTVRLGAAEMNLSRKDVTES